MDADVYVSYGDIRTSAAALDVIPALAPHGKADISVNPKF